MPTPPLSGLILWLKPETLPAGSLGDPVTSWADSSGSGNNFTSGLAQLVPSGTAGQIPGLKFSTGLGDTLSGPNFSFNNNNSSVFFVTQTLQNASGPDDSFRVVVAHAGVSFSYSIVGNWGSYAIGSGPDASATNSGTDTGPSFLFTPGLVGFVGDGSGGTWYSGNLTSTTTVSQPTDSTSVTVTRLGGISGVDVLGGILGEILIYNRPLNPTETSNVIAYLNAKFNLFGTLTLSLSDSIFSSDSLNDALAVSISDSVNLSDTSPQAFSIQSDFIASVHTPIVENLVNQLVPAEVKTYFKIEE